MKRNFLTGFTLIELIVVVIIVGILAAVAMPMMQNMKARAIATEAVAGISAIRQAVKNYSIGLPANTFIRMACYGGPTFIPDGRDINSSDFEGTYFSKECYRGYKSEDGATLWGRCYFVLNTSGKATEINKLTNDGTSSAYIDIDKNGRITQINFSRSGYPSS